MSFYGVKTRVVASCFPLFFIIPLTLVIWAVGKFVSREIAPSGYISWLAPYCSPCVGNAAAGGEQGAEGTEACAQASGRGRQRQMQMPSLRK